MNWEDLRYFLQLARLGTLSETSRSMAVEHTTIARRVAALEAGLDLRLFERLPRGWRLTEEGRQLVPLAEVMESSAAAIERRVASAMGGIVRVAAAPVFATHFLTQRLDRLLARRADLSIEMSTSRHATNLLRGEADVALRIGAREVPPGLIAKEIGRVGYGLYAKGDGWRRFIGFDDTMRDTAQKHFLDAQSRNARIVLRSNDLLVHYQAARAGLGVALLPHFLVQPEDELLLDDRDRAPFFRPLSLLMLPTVRRVRSVAAVVKFITEETKREAEILSGPRPGIRRKSRR